MTETIAYRMLEKLEDVEIRQYESYILATVRGVSDDEAFGILFDYIAGNNRAKSKIPMTAPAISAPPGSTKVAMTTPVISSPGSFSFVLPQSLRMDTAPDPLDSRIQLTRVPPNNCAVLRFGGRASAARVRQKAAELVQVLESKGLKMSGEPFLMRYNPPFTPGFLRRNEVGVVLA